MRRGDRVAIAGPGFGLQLVLLLTAESTGAATASFRRRATRTRPSCSSMSIGCSPACRIPCRPVCAST
ncbi:hypothetical protein HK414_10085 [Ramlibacter terrae]|uniref:Uncharacterized protein n=1 Tax=Ramlibacter terrae TaxID=2732511 RepID=A0ABX6P1Z1_9BURK|nr:hypothetical protein HK414_10085 [Ramlibacter terrae]